MASTVTPGSSPVTGATQTPKQRFLDVYQQEHERTMRVLKAYPADKAELRPHAMCKTARELAWVFAIERGLGAMAFNNAFAAGRPAGSPPKAPDSWDAVLSGVEKAHTDFGDLIRAAPDETLGETVKFFVAPKTMGDVRRIDLLWFLLHDEIHHRGQLSIYLRMAGAKVPSIYGPTADEPWM
jgi:uncharacterized damage-inducible protein DinB